MLGFEPTDEQKMLVEAVHRYAENDLRAAAHEADESGELPVDLIEKGWELGVLQASVPVTYGGLGERSAVTGALAAEELAWGDLSGALAVMAPGGYALSVLLAGSEDQKSGLIPPVIEADWKPYVTAFVEYPDGIQFRMMPITDDSGVTQIEIPLQGRFPGSRIALEYTVVYEGLSALTRDSFYIWY